MHARLARQGDIQMNSVISGKSVRSIFAAGLMLVLAFEVQAAAQTYQGALRGAVRDPQGVIPGAEVTLINEDTNAERIAMTNEVGEYAFASVLPGTYTVRVALPGFKTEERKGFRIGTQQSAVLDFTLEVGAISEQITVTGEAPLVERASATQAASLDKEALQNLPIFGRNTFFAAISTPGVIQTGDPQFVRYQDQSGSSQLSLGGGPRRGNGYLIEGVSITDLTNRPTIAPSMEAVEELKVQTKTYEADMGHAAGGVFNTTARSGSNTWHGQRAARQQAGRDDRDAVLREAGRAREPAAVLLQLGRLGRRPDRQGQDVLLVQHRRLQAAQHAQQRADAADGGRARRRLLADAQLGRPAGDHLRPADDAHRQRRHRARPVSRQRHSGGSDQPGGQGDARADAAADRRQVVQRAGDAR